MNAATEKYNSTVYRMTDKAIRGSISYAWLNPFKPINAKWHVDVLDTPASLDDIERAKSFARKGLWKRLPAWFVMNLALSVFYGSLVLMLDPVIQRSGALGAAGAIIFYVIFLLIWGYFVSNALSGVINLARQKKVLDDFEFMGVEALEHYASQTHGELIGKFSPDVRQYIQSLCLWDRLDPTRAEVEMLWRCQQEYSQKLEDMARINKKQEAIDRVKAKFCSSQTDGDEASA